MPVPQPSGIIGRSTDMWRYGDGGDEWVIPHPFSHGNNSKPTPSEQMDAKVQATADKAAGSA